MPDNLTGQKIKKIVLTGPESSGKTTLASDLAAHWGVPWLGEYARLYLQSKGPSYTYEDYLHIVQGQLYWEDSMFERMVAADPPWPKPLLIADTGALVLKIWGEIRFGKYPARLETALYTYALFVLCRPDIPYEPDPLRESPRDREMLYRRYKANLLKYKLPFLEVYGDRSQRLQLLLDYLSSKVL